jgi:cytochrome c oxidase accessory protein FixG
MNSVAPEGAPSHAPSRSANPSDFRECLATADAKGRRKWLRPRQPSGPLYQKRKLVGWILLAVLFTGPFVKINGNPLLMLNFFAGRFSIFGRIFWPQDMALLAVALLIYVMSIMIFTAAFGRLWCGWTCPQTIFMEMVFRRIEYAVEGDSASQKALDQRPWDARKIRIKLFKHAIFFALSFVIGNLFLSYIIGIEKLRAIVTEPVHQHWQGLVCMLLFTGVFYLVFARFREQACTFICPYGRFQSTMIDENTLVVAYDHKRGEKRSSVRKRDAGAGDCVDCKMCVQVCPTGIDIRNGIQMECVNCTACIDACNSVMTKLKRPLGLIRYASLNSLERGRPFQLTPRLKLYAAALTALASLLMFLVLTRGNVEATLLRAPGELFQRLPNGHLENLYTVSFVNKSSAPVPIEMKLEDLPGTLSIMGDPHPVVPKEQHLDAPILVEIAEKEALGGHRDFKIGIYSAGKRLQLIRTSFLGPRTGN